MKFNQAQRDILLKLSKAANRIRWGSIPDPAERKKATQPAIKARKAAAKARRDAEDQEKIDALPLSLTPDQFKAALLGIKAQRERQEKQMARNNKLAQARRMKAMEEGKK